MQKPLLSAIIEQLSKVQHTSNLYYTEPCAQLAKMLCERTGMKKVFFGNSGAEANECAIKVARKYGADKKMHRSAIHTVSPYQMILHNQRYYLMGYNEKWQHIQYYRMDRITNWSSGSGGQLNNSLIAIGSAGMFGHGFNHTPIYFPELQTDFIFGVSFSFLYS